jgi:hypothetical protein
MGYLPYVIVEKNPLSRVHDVGRKTHHTEIGLETMTTSQVERLKSPYLKCFV